MSFRVLNVVSV